jgi:NAD(P)-dependent dehydrogenase (short-subunit alcohol dehydrogenase family)
MSKPAEIAQMIAACEQRFGSIDVLINNAGIQQWMLNLRNMDLSEDKAPEAARQILVNNYPPIPPVPDRMYIPMAWRNGFLPGAIW